MSNTPVLDVATVVLAIFTGTLAVVAAFQDKIRGWLLKPKLSLSIHLAPPDCHKIPMTIIIRNVKGAEVAHDVRSYYFRLRVRNDGNQRAELVEVFASELSKKQADGTFRKESNFLPMNLKWSHLGTRVFDAISPGMEKHCDLGHIIHPEDRDINPYESGRQLGFPSDKTILSLDLEVQPFTMSHLVPPGTYRLVLIVGAANAKPVTKTLEVSLPGDWHDDERKMLGEGIGIKVV